MTVRTEDHPTRGDTATTPPGGTRTYAKLWPLQYLSGYVIAIATLGIAIRANAFAAFENGSAILVAVAFSLTFLAFTPMSVVSGRLVDRFGAKPVLVASNIGYLAIIAIALVALAVDFFPPWLAIALLLSRTGSQSAQITALETSVPALFSRRDLVRANGSRLMLTASVAGFEAPIAEALFPVTGLLAMLVGTGVVLVWSLVGAVRADIPDPVVAPLAVDPRPGYRPLREHLRRRPGLIVVLAGFALFNFAFGFAELSDRIITSSLGSDLTTSVVLGVGFVFMLVATVAVTLRGTPRGHLRWLRISFAGLGLALVLAGLRPNLVLITAAVVLFLVSATVVMAIVSTLLHLNTPSHLMGRMMGLKTMMIGLFYGAGNIAAALFSNSPTAIAGGDRVDGGFLGALVGSGDAAGRVYALLTLVLGVVVLGLVVTVGRHRSLSDLDDQDVEDVATRTVRSQAASPVGDLAVNPAAAG